MRAHVATALAAAHVPADQRADLAEELFGHLVERWRALVTDGVEPDRAARRAIVEFGGARRIGQDLTRAYHGHFWASTVGVLLPAVGARVPQPRAVWWLGVSLRFYAVVYALLSAALALNASPMIALVLLLFAVPAIAFLFLAAAALPRRQRWALDLALVVNVIGLVLGLREMFTTPGLFSLNVVASGLILAIAAVERQTLGRWVRRSRPVRNTLAIAILVVVLGFFVLPAAARDLPDPTQAQPDDLYVELAIECHPRRVILTADVRWDRTSLLPGGLANLDQYGDVLVLDQSSEQVWRLDNSPTLVQPNNGNTVAEPGEAYAPNQERTVLALRGMHVIQIGWDALEPGVTYRATWIFIANDDIRDPDMLQVGVEYIHADRFRWETLADCARGIHEPFVSDWP